MEDNIIWYNKDGRFYDCSSCSMPNCSSRNTTSKSNCLLDKHEVTAQEIDNKVMKANTPEKIYIVNDDSSIKREWYKTKQVGFDTTEYTRTDAFIEKAEGWLREVQKGFILTDKDITDFVNYMKGE